MSFGNLDLEDAEYWDFSPEPQISEEGTFEVYQFVTALDERVCPQCGPLDSSYFTADEIMTNFPNATEVLPGMVDANIHVNCRCQLIAEPFTGTEAGSEVFEELMEGY